MTFPSALSRPEEKVLLSQHSGILVKTLKKRRRVFFINVFTLFCLQLPLVRSDQVGEMKKGRCNISSVFFSLGKEDGGQRGAPLLLPVFFLLVLLLPNISCSYSPSFSPTRTRTYHCLSGRGRGPGSSASFSEEKETQNRAVLLYSSSVSLLSPSFSSFSSFPILLPLLPTNSRIGWGGSRGEWRRPGGREADDNCGIRGGLGRRKA